MMDFDNIQGLIDYYRDFMSSHDLKNVDFSGYKKINLFNKADLASNDHLRNLMEMDSHGEYLGRYFHEIKSDKPDDKYIDIDYFAVFDGDRLVAILMQPRLTDSFVMELFEYHEDYYIGVKCAVVTKLLASGLTFYMSSGDKVTEMITVHDLEILNKVRIDRTNLEYVEGKASVKSSVASLYKKSAKGYELEKQWDLLNPPKSQKKTKRVIDNQKKLCKMLEKETKQAETLDQAIDAFFKVVSSAKPNDEEMLLYEVGCYSFDGPEECQFSLVRQTPTRDDEFYQMHMEVTYEAGEEERQLSECEWHEEGDDDLREYVHRSKAYIVLKNKQFLKISVWVDET